MTDLEFNKVIYLLTTHTDHEGSYCDTGEDMDWSCRSRCVEAAEKRLRQEFKKELEF